MCIACRTYASYAEDLEQLAGSLGVQQFYVIGVSGGGPYTYAAAAYLPDRVLGVMTISTLAQAGDHKKDSLLCVQPDSSANHVCASALRSAVCHGLWTVCKAGYVLKECRSTSSL